MSVDRAGDASWVARVVERGRRDVDEELAGADPAAAGVARAALEKLAARQDDVASLTATGFATVLSRLALGEINEAELAFLRSGRATFAERLSALDAASAATRREAAEREATWARVKEVALDVLVALGKAAVPLVLAAL